MIAGGVASLLIWVSLAGQEFAWGSWQTALLVALGVSAQLSLLSEQLARQIALTALGG